MWDGNARENACIGSSKVLRAEAMDRLPFIVLVFAAGAAFPVQAVLNARLAQGVGGPLWASFVSFLVGTLVLGVVAYAAVGSPRVLGALSWPWYLWMGGVIGALFVFSITLSTPSLGTAVVLSLIVCGQMLTALLLDRFGVLQSVRPIGPFQGIGALLLVTGVMMIVFGPRE